jgi:hypothetical protein
LKNRAAGPDQDDLQGHSGVSAEQIWLDRIFSGRSCQQGAF